MDHTMKWFGILSIALAYGLLGCLMILSDPGQSIWIWFLVAFIPLTPITIWLIALGEKRNQMVGSGCGCGVKAPLSIHLWLHQTTILWIVTMFMADQFAKQDLSPAFRFATSMLPLPGFVAVALVELAYVKYMDEFQRRILLEALAIAFPAALAVCFIGGNMQEAGVISAVNINKMIWPWMVFTIIPAYAIAWWRYR
ncbi:MAG: hypothetical protein GC154_21825 [bacterium]|nr:hypothetical protein [bacterium]